MAQRVNDPEAGTFAGLLRAAIAARGLPLDRVQAHLASAGHTLSTATLSYWQTGRSVPRRAASLEALAALEAVLAVPPGSLVAAARVAQLPEDYSSSAPELSVRADITEAMTRRSRELGLSPDDGLERVMMSFTSRVDAHRSQFASTTVTYARAVHSGINRIPVGVIYDHPLLPPLVAARHECTIGRTIDDPQARMLMVELLFPYTLTTGEAIVFGMEVTEAEPPPPACYLEVGMVMPIKALHLEVRFTPGVLPRRVWEYWRDPAGGTATSPLRCGTAHARLLVTDTPIGVHGIAWEW